MAYFEDFQGDIITCSLTMVAIFPWHCVKTCGWQFSIEKQERRNGRQEISRWCFRTWDKQQMCLIVNNSNFAWTGGGWTYSKIMTRQEWNTTTTKTGGGKNSGRSRRIEGEERTAELRQRTMKSQLKIIEKDEQISWYKSCRGLALWSRS